MLIGWKTKSISWARHLLCQDAPHQSHCLLEVTNPRNDFLGCRIWRLLRQAAHFSRIPLPKNHLASPCTQVRKTSFRSSRDKKHFLGQAICCGRTLPTCIASQSPSVSRWEMEVPGLVLMVSSFKASSERSLAGIPIELCKCHWSCRWRLPQVRRRTNLLEEQTFFCQIETWPGPLLLLAGEC